MAEDIKKTETLPEDGEKAPKAAKKTAATAPEKTVKTEKTTSEKAVKTTKKVAKEVKIEKKIKVTLVKSVIGSKKDQIATVEALGLKKIRQFNIIKDNAAARGMINKVSHLVSVSEVE